MALPAYALAASATLKALRGNVSVRQGDKLTWDSVKDQTVVKEGDQIKTEGDSRAFLVLENDHRVAVGPDTVLILREASKGNTFLFLESGKIRNKVRKLQAGQSYKVQTPPAVAAVRGTDFEARPDRFTCFEGELGVNRINQITKEVLGEPVLVQAGHSLILEPGAREMQLQPITPRAEGQNPPSMQKESDKSEKSKEESKESPENSKGPSSGDHKGPRQGFGPPGSGPGSWRPMPPGSSGEGQRYQQGQQPWYDKMMENHPEWKGGEWKNFDPFSMMHGPDSMKGGYAEGESGGPNANRRFDQFAWNNKGGEPYWGNWKDKPEGQHYPYGDEGKNYNFNDPWGSRQDPWNFGNNSYPQPGNNSGYNGYSYPQDGSGGGSTYLPPTGDSGGGTTATQIGNQALISELQSQALSNYLADLQQQNLKAEGNALIGPDGRWHLYASAVVKRDDKTIGFVNATMLKDTPASLNTMTANMTFNQSIPADYTLATRTALRSDGATMPTYWATDVKTVRSHWNNSKPVDSLTVESNGGAPTLVSTLYRYQTNFSHEKTTVNNTTLWERTGTVTTFLGGSRPSTFSSNTGWASFDIGNMYANGVTFGHHLSWFDSNGRLAALGTVPSGTSERDYLINNLYVEDKIYSSLFTSGPLEAWGSAQLRVLAGVDSVLNNVDARGILSGTGYVGVADGVVR